MSKLILPTLLAALCLVGLKTRAMDPDTPLEDYILNNLTTRDGLPQLTVQCLVQGREGYIWIGTQEGLARFDGISFTVFNHRNSPLEDSNVRVLTEDKEGRLWIGTRNGAVTWHKDGVFHQLDPGLGQNGVTALMNDRYGRIWVGSRAGLKIYEDGEFSDFPGLAFMPGGWVTALLEDRFGDIWIGTQGDGVLKYSGGKTTVLTMDDGLCENDITALAEDRSGGIWIGSGNAGLNYFQRGKISHFGLKEGLPSLAVTALLWDRDRNLWIGASGRGLIRYNNGVFTAFPQEDPRGSDVILSILEDREGHLWAGSRSRGLERMANSRVQTLTSKDGLEDEVTWALYEDSKSNVWISTDLKGIYKYHDGKFTPYAKKIDLRPSASVTCMVEGSDGALWIATSDYGLVSLDGENTIRHELPGDQMVRGSMQPAPVYALYLDKQKRLWVAHGGVSVYENGQWRHFPPEFTPSPVRCFYEDHFGVFWFGADEGAYRLEGDVVTKPETSGWPEEAVDFIFEDSLGGLWFITETGLIRYKDGHCNRLEKKDGLFTAWVFSIIEDSERNLWFSCNKGIFRVSLEEIEQYLHGQIPILNYQALGQADGMKSAECNYTGPSSALKLKNGQLWYPTLRGIVIVEPSKVKRYMKPPVVVVESLKWNAGQTSQAKGAVLPPGSRDFEFDYTAFFYHSPKMTQFRYQLVGFDENPVNAGTRRFARYSKLKPGLYRFRVFAANSEGAWNMDGAEFSFELKPFFHQTIAFYILCILVVALSFFLIHALRLKQHRQHEERLELMVQESTEELARTNEDLVTANRRLADNARQSGMAEIATEVLHNIGNTMNSANTSANMMDKLLREDLDSRVVRHVSDLVRENEDNLAAFFLEDPKGRKILHALSQLCPILSESQEALAEEVGIFLAQVHHIKEIVNSQLRLEPNQDEATPFDPHQVIEDLIKMQAPYLRGIRVDLNWTAPAETRVCISKSDFMQVIINLIKNAGEAIHMGPPENEHVLYLKSTIEDERLILEFRDTGCGIKAESMAYLFRHGYTTKTTGHGFGLHYCYKVVGEMDGVLKASSPGEGMGASFSLALPFQLEASA